MKWKPTIAKKVKIARAEKGAGLGLFADEDIAKDEYIIDYGGIILPNAKCTNHPGKYLFEVDDHFTIDGSGRENIARYINHSCAPNCEAVIEDGEIKINSIKQIKKGEELCYDYGKEYFNQFIKPLGCKCIKCMKKITKI